jgi:hypothetical protein
MASKLPKAFYSEVEAARYLGITIDQFRAHLRQHVGAREDELSNSPVTTFHASDILLLKMALAGAITMPERTAESDAAAAASAAAKQAENAAAVVIAAPEQVLS